MTDAVLASIVGGLIAATLKGIDYYIENKKRAAEKETRYEDQRAKFLETVLDRLEHVNEELNNAETEADEYKAKYWKSLEDRINELEQRGNK
jgi:hypothetical protein